MTLANKLGALAVLVGDAIADALDDVSPSAAALLLTLSYRRRITVTELARVAGVAQPTAARVFDGLVERGWVERQPRAGRLTPLHLTPLGRQQARALQAARLAALGQIAEGLPARERRGFELGLDALLAAATSSRAAARTICRLCDHHACDGALCPIGTRADALERAAAGAEVGRASARNHRGKRK